MEQQNRFDALADQQLDNDACIAKNEESWANIAENKDKDQRMLVVFEKKPTPSVFKLITSKASKKKMTSN